MYWLRMSFAISRVMESTSSRLCGKNATPPVLAASLLQRLARGSSHPLIHQSNRINCGPFIGLQLSDRVFQRLPAHIVLTVRDDQQDFLIKPRIVSQMDIRRHNGVVGCCAALGGDMMQSCLQQVDVESGSGQPG